MPSARKTKFADQRKPGQIWITSGQGRGNPPRLGPLGLGMPDGGLALGPPCPRPPGVGMVMQLAPSMEMEMAMMERASSRSFMVEEEYQVRHGYQSFPLAFPRLQFFATRAASAVIPRSPCRCNRAISAGHRRCFGPMIRCDAIASIFPQIPSPRFRRSRRGSDGVAWRP